MHKSLMLLTIVGAMYFAGLYTGHNLAQQKFAAEAAEAVQRAVKAEHLRLQAESHILSLQKELLKDAEADPDADLDALGPNSLQRLNRIR